MSAISVTPVYQPAMARLLSSQQYVASAVAPHGATTRLSYTNNTYYPAIVEYSFVRKSQAVAPSAYAESGIILLVNTVRHFLDTNVLSAGSPFYNSRHSLNLRLAHNDTLEVQTFDGSTGGSITWVVAVQITGV